MFRVWHYFWGSFVCTINKNETLNQKFMDQLGVWELGKIWSYSSSFVIMIKQAMNLTDLVKNCLGISLKISLLKNKCYSLAQNSYIFRQGLSPDLHNTYNSLLTSPFRCHRGTSRHTTLLNQLLPPPLSLS